MYIAYFYLLYLFHIIYIINTIYYSLMSIFIYIYNSNSHVGKKWLFIFILKNTNQNILKMLALSKWVFFPPTK